MYAMSAVEVLTTDEFTILDLHAVLSQEEFVGALALRFSVVDVHMHALLRLQVWSLVPATVASVGEAVSLER